MLLLLSRFSRVLLCSPIDGSPPGSPVPGILQARTLEWVAISFYAWKWKVKVKSLSCVRPSVTPWTVAFQAPPSMGFSRQEYWSGVPLPSPSQSSYSTIYVFFRATVTATKIFYCCWVYSDVTGRQVKEDKELKEIKKIFHYVSFYKTRWLYNQECKVGLTLKGSSSQFTNVF